MSIPYIPQPEVPYSALIGQVIKQARVEQGGQQLDMANLLGLSQSAYSRLENGDSMFSVWQMRECAKLLKMTPSEVLRRVEVLEEQLSKQNVPVVEAKKANPAGALVGIALLLALLSSMR
ncbi:helix-turn-helix domain-containing protein [Burkholderiaceae bacterium UC74_6]